jgi:hypothetical protein
LNFEQDHALTEATIGCAMKVHRQLGTRLKRKHRRKLSQPEGIDLQNPVNPFNPV